MLGHGQLYQACCCGCPSLMPCLRSSVLFENEEMISSKGGGEGQEGWIQAWFMAACSQETLAITVDAQTKAHTACKGHRAATTAI